MPPISRPPPTRRTSAAAAASALFLFLLLLPTPLPRTAAQPASAPPNPPLPPRPSTTTSTPTACSSSSSSSSSSLPTLPSSAAAPLPPRAASPFPWSAASPPPRGLDPAIVETFPTVIYSAVKGHKIGGASLECVVCLNDFEDEDMLRLIPKCDHAFHPDCIGTWLNSHNTCPVCRAEFASQPAGDSESQQAESGTELPRVQVVVEAAPLDVGTPERSQRGREREGIQPPDLWDQNESGSLNKRQMRRFSRSHSTGHSLIRPDEDTERFTLRLPAEVRKQLMDRPRPDRAHEGSSRRGYRRGGEGSSRGRYFRRPDRLDRAAKSEWWAFFVRASSALSPRVAADGDGGSAQQAQPVI